MKRDNFLRFSLPMISAIIFLIGGCNSKLNREQEILGEWNAHWETDFDESMPDLTSDNLKMNGILNFMPDGKVEISAFGYAGCIFSDDTLKNVLNWKLEDSILRFIDSGDEHGLPYTISKFTTNELQLTLLEDISLTLSKN